MINKHKIKSSDFALLDQDYKTIVNGIKGESVNIENLNQKSNIINQQSEPSNNVVVHTRKDNLVHNYFHSFYLYWDAGDVLSSVTLKFPKTETGNTQYWITYTGEVDIYIGANVSNEKHETTSENQSAVSATYWNLQNMYPLFRGEVGVVKEYKNVLEIHVDSIGKRFKQKIPDEFRQMYINGQNVRDAFQAICEFLGVKYICPPAAPPTEDENTDEESSDTDGTENNVTDKKQAEQQMQNQVSNIADQVASNVDKTQNNSNTANSNVENQTINVETPQNGYSDVMFDQNGAIVHNSTVIETSPNMADTLIELNEHPLTKYMTDTKFVAADVKRLLDGEFFDTVHNSVLSYGAITVGPSTATSSNMSIESDTTITNNIGENTDESNSNNSSQSSNRNSTNTNKNGWINGQYYVNGKISLSKEYIRTLSTKQAAEKYKKGKNTYTKATLKRLLLRSSGDMLLR